jgi:hypothetical protein
MIYEIRQRKDPSTEAMDINNVMLKTTFPGATAGSTLRKNLNGWATGLTPEEVQSYGELVGEDLSSKSEYWDSYFINLTSPKNEYIKIDTGTPDGYIVYKASLASGIVSPDRDSLNTPKYLKTNFYFFAVLQEQKNKKLLNKERNGLISKLSSHEENEDWLLFVNYCLGLPTSFGMEIDRLYNQLDGRIKQITKESEIKMVKEIFEKSPLDLQTKFVIEKAVDKKVMKYDSTDNAYTYNNITWGSTKDAVMDKVTDPQYTETLQELTELILKDYR